MLFMTIVKSLTLPHIYREMSGGDTSKTVRMDKIATHKPK